MASTDKKSSTGRYIAYSIVAIILALIGNEYLSFQKFNSAQTWLNENVISKSASAAKPSLDAVMAQIGGSAGEFVERPDKKPYVDVKWFSLLQNNELRLSVDGTSGDSEVVNFMISEGYVDEVVVKEEVGDENSGGGDDEEEAQQASAGGGGGGGRGPGGGGRGPGGGGFGGGRRRGGGVGRMLGNPVVQRLMNLSEEKVAQAEALRPDTSAIREMSDEERRSMFEEVQSKTAAFLSELSPDEKNGLVSGHIAQMGFGALVEDFVAQTMDVTDDQKEQIQGLMGDYNSERQEESEGGYDAQVEVDKAWQDRFFEVLTDEQQAQWKERVQPLLSPAE